MILHDKKIIFVHIPKTGGHSIHNFLLFNKPLDRHCSYPEYGLIDNTDLSLPGPKRYDHLFLDEYYKLNVATKNQIETYFKFCVVRNPYDRFLSAWKFNKLYKTMTFDQFINNFPEDDKSDLFRHFCPQHFYISSNYTLDLFFKLDDVKFTEKFTHYFEKNFNYKNVELKKLNATKSIKNTKKVPILNRYAINFIQRYYKKDFELFNYSVHYKGDIYE